MQNNPLRYTDPSGHKACELVCEGDRIDWIEAKKGAAWYGEWNIAKQKANEAKAEAILYGGTELAASVLFEPADWAITAYHCANRDCSPLALLGLLPLIPASAGRHGDDVVDLYRAVSKSEMDDILSTGSFRPRTDGPSMDAKWFWETYEGAEGWLQNRGLDNIVQVTVPRSVLDVASLRLPKLDGLGPAVSFIDEGLDTFNQAIISIKSIWSP